MAGGVQFFEAIVTDPAPDPGLPGFVKVRIPELFGQDELPYLVGPIYPGWTAGGWQSTPTATLPVADTDETEVRLVVVKMAPYVYRYIGTTQGWSEVEASSGTKSGMRSSSGNHWIVVDEAGGLQIVVGGPTQASPKSFVTIAPDGSICVGSSFGSMINIGSTGLSVQDSSGTTVALTPDGVTVMSADGAGVLVVGAASKIIAPELQVITGATTMVAQGGFDITHDPTGAAPRQPMVLGTSFMTALLTFLNGCVADAAMSPGVAAAAAVMAAQVTTSLSAGAPYLSINAKTT